jgi:hypothetical protein
VAGSGSPRGSREWDNQSGRRSDPLDYCGEHISHAALRLDDAWCARVAFQLAPQAKNLHVDAAIEDVLMNASGLQQVLATERTLWSIEKGEEQGILALGECYWSTGWIGELSSLAVELPTAKAIATACRISGRRGATAIEPS